MYQQQKERVMEAFEAYVSKYNLQDPNILLKYIHTKKVAENCEIISKTLDLTEKEIFLAWMIGMLHDIGRFEQLRRFDTFNDAESIDHANFGADLLFTEGLIEQFYLQKEDYPLIEAAIRSHSLYRIPETVTEYERMFCQIIRDADKVDIYRANYDTGICVVYHVTEEQFLNSAVSDEVMEIFMEERAIPRNVRRTVADHLVGHFALSFELVYPVSRKLVKEQGYLERLLATRFQNEETNRAMERVRKKLAETLYSE